MDQDDSATGSRTASMNNAKGMSESADITTNEALPDVSDGSTKSSVSTRMISGSIGSVITSLVVTPLEVVKVRTQAAGALGTGVSVLTVGRALVTPNPVSSVPIQLPSKSCSWFVVFNGHSDCLLAKKAVPFFETTAASSYRHAASSDKRLGTFAMVRRIFATEGFSGIYAGLRPTLIMAAPNTVLYYTAYEEIVWKMRHFELLHRISGDPMSTISPQQQQQNKQRYNHTEWLFPLLAGGTARLISSTVTAPLEFLRTRQAAAIGVGQTQASQIAPTTLWQEISTIVKTEGVSTLYRGLRPTLWRDVPFSAIYWLVLEQLRLLWKPSATVPSAHVPLSLHQQFGQAFINGALAGMFAAACTTPFDLAKTLQQTYAHNSLPPMKSTSNTFSKCQNTSRVLENRPSPDGTFHTLRLIAQSDGVAGLWRGNQARMLKVTPACAIMLSSYEIGKRILE